MRARFPVPSVKQGQTIQKKSGWKTTHFYSFSETYVSYAIRYSWGAAPWIVRCTDSVFFARFFYYSSFNNTVLLIKLFDLLICVWLCVCNSVSCPTNGIHFGLYSFPKRPMNGTLTLLKNQREKRGNDSVCSSASCPTNEIFFFCTVFPSDQWTAFNGWASMTRQSQWKRTQMGPVMSSSEGNIFRTRSMAQKQFWYEAHGPARPDHAQA